MVPRNARRRKRPSASDPRLALSTLRPDVVAVPLTASPARRIVVAWLADRRLSLAVQEAVAVCRQVAHGRAGR